MAGQLAVSASDSVLNPASSSLRRYGQLSLIILAGGAVYPLVYLRQNFEVTLLEAFGISGVDLRDTYSLLGAIFVLTYIPSGWLADRFSPRSLLTFSLAATGLLGFWYATLPELWAFRFIFMAWGVTTGLTFWASMIKSVSLIADAQDQGRFFGLLDGGRGLVEAVLASIALVIFAYALESAEVSSSAALQRVIVFYSLASLLVAPLIWVTLPHDAAAEAESKSPSTFWADLRELARNRALWLAALCMLTGYQLFWATYSLSAYLQSFLGLSAVMVGTFTVAKLWMRPIGATLAGFAGDFWGREEVMAALLVASSLTFIVLTQVPVEMGAFLILGVVLMLGLLTYGIRGIFWATLERAEVDVRLKGLAIGLLSFIGYAPDFYQPWISARLIEAFPGKLGFDLYYWLVAFFGVLGALATLRLRRSSEV